VDSAARWTRQGRHGKLTYEVAEKNAVGVDGFGKNQEHIRSQDSVNFIGDET
jgi:hypothetical protein